eukprot:scaffold56360_cov31-Tisochrysis_lutea.AAC.1
MDSSTSCTILFPYTCQGQNNSPKGPLHKKLTAERKREARQEKQDLKQTGEAEAPRRRETETDSLQHPSIQLIG